MEDAIKTISDTSLIKIELVDNYMLTLIIGEAALETIPKILFKHPSVAKPMKLKNRYPDNILLDRSFHHFAMNVLSDAHKRGRPDLVHFSLLEATSTPLYLNNKLNIHVHTVVNKVITLGTLVRPPRSYFRFARLIEKLFNDGEIIGNDATLLKLNESPLTQLIDNLNTNKTIGLSRLGKKSTPQDVAKKLAENESSTLVVGGFPKGNFSKEIPSHFDELLSIHDMPLDANVVISRVLYEFEKLI